jgi:hypothetical protein
MQVCYVPSYVHTESMLDMMEPAVARQLHVTVSQRVGGP